MRPYRLHRTQGALVAIALASLFVTNGVAQDQSPADQSSTTGGSDGAAQDLAKATANPVSSLISLPIQTNFDFNIGPDDDGFRMQTNIQPVIPFGITDDWNLISRTIVPIVYQDDIFPGSGDQFGLGDIVQSLFFSPKEPSARGGIIWGLGPVMLLPTATDELLGGEKWGAGPTGVVLKQSGHWTYGLLANHIWSFAGDGGRADVNATFMQPFVSYTTPKAWTFTLNTESTYDWESDNWSVPINAQVSKVTRIGNQPVSVFGGLRYWADSPSSGPEGIGLRAGISLLFPKK